MVALRVFNEDNTLIERSIFRAYELLAFLVRNMAIPDFAHLTIENSHPTTVTRMVMDWGLSSWSPAQQKKGERLMIRSYKISRVVFLMIKVRKALPVVVLQTHTTTIETTKVFERAT